jgi:hypothetical protein
VKDTQRGVIYQPSRKSGNAESLDVLRGGAPFLSQLLLFPAAIENRLTTSGPATTHCRNCRCDTRDPPSILIAEFPANRKFRQSTIDI